MQTCPNCGYANRPGGVFCENCGATLIGGVSPLKTRSLADKATGTLDPSKVEDSSQVLPVGADIIGEQGTEEFPEDGVLRLEVGEGTKPMLISIPSTVVFGRRDAATGSAPDVDLTPFAGYRMGVSRRHAEIRRDVDNPRRIVLWDLGSSNGTFLNGDRLISHRAYVLHNGDQVRFGQLSIRVYFQRGSLPDTSPLPPLEAETPAKTGPVDTTASETQLPVQAKSETLAKPTSSEEQASAQLPDRNQTTGGQQQADSKPSSDQPPS
jgi:pSer/pThr/pTyr-binding forkhead associated (FHA) protein